MHEATKFARDINEIVAGIALNQNQFDALVSFTYNVGPGALRSSTLLKKLKQGKFEAAAKEFERWNKGTVGGVKKVLPGLTIRRQIERALFERPTGMGDPLPDEVSDQEKAVMLQGFRDGDQHIIVARDEAGAAVDIVELADNGIDALRSVLSQYPNANKFEGRVWKDGLGPAKIYMCFKQPGKTRRSAIEIHIDWNKSGGKPGSAGCICPHDVAGFKTLVSWLRDTDPRSVYVDWDLGTCPEPQAPEATSSEKPCKW